MYNDAGGGGCFPGVEKQGCGLVHPTYLVMRSKLDATRTLLLCAYMAWRKVNLFFCTTAQQPLVIQGLLIVEASRSHSVRHTTVGRTPLNEWLAHRRDLYLTTQNTHKRQISMPIPGLEPAIPANERPQTHVLDRAAIYIYIYIYIYTHTHTHTHTHCRTIYGETLNLPLAHMPSVITLCIAIFIQGCW